MSKNTKKVLIVMYKTGNSEGYYYFTADSNSVSYGELFIQAVQKLDSEYDHYTITNVVKL